MKSVQKQQLAALSGGGVSSATATEASQALLGVWGGIWMQLEPPPEKHKCFPRLKAGGGARDECRLRSGRAETAATVLRCVSELWSFWASQQNI